MRKELPVNQIITGDSARVLQLFPSRSVHLIVTSPPYNAARSYTHEFNANVFHLEKILIESWRVLMDGGVMVIVVGDTTVAGSETGLPSQIETFIRCVLHMNLHDSMIFEKNSAAHRSSNRYQQVFEFMYIFSKNGKPRTVHLIKDHPIKNENKKSWGKRTSRQTDGTLIETVRKTNNNTHDIRRNIFKYNVGGCGVASSFKNVKNHPASFPDALAENHIYTWSNRGDIVLDPFSGSGTTCAMAKKHGRKYIGIDISAEYCELSQDRINHTVQIEPDDDQKN
ncbi:MAG: site-specific DNA-methyltransferase [Nitrospirae bacterium]|nr:site-specific DNA-methyltransferase [Nitrospirota bacterium]